MNKKTEKFSFKSLIPMVLALQRFLRNPYNIVEFDYIRYYYYPPLILFWT